MIKKFSSRETTNHISACLSLSDFDLKILVFQLQMERSQKSSFLGPNPHYFWIFSWKVDARVIVITVMQKFGEKCVYIVWFMAILEGGHISPLKLHPEAPRHWG